MRHFGKEIFDFICFDVVMNRKKVLRISAASMSLKYLLEGQLRFLNTYFQVKGVASPDELLDKVSHAEGIETIGVPIARKISMMDDLVSLWCLIRLFVKERPDIVHSMTPKAGLLSMVAAKIAGIPIRIHSFTGVIFPCRTGFMYHLLKNMDRITCACATTVLPEGEGVKRDLVVHRVTRKKLRVLGNGNINGIDTQFFSKALFVEKKLDVFRDKYHIKKSDFVFVFIGRLVGDKGINELVSAFETVSKKDPELKLILVGPREWHLDPLESTTVKAIKDHPDIIETGWQHDVRPFLAMADVFVFPSYREGFPNVVLQAGAMELPSIVTDVNGSNEIIIDGENGIIVPSKDSVALSEAMRRLCHDAAKRKEMERKARPMVLDRYEQRFVWMELLNLYRSALKAI